MTVQIKLRRDTAANWTSVNPTLASGEPGLETDTLKVKYGDGATPWVSLAYPTNIATVVNASSGLSGTTLASNITASSLTSVASTGLVNLTVQNTINGSINGNAATASQASALTGGVANQLVYQTGSNTTAFITVPSSANTYLTWNGSGFTWSAGSTTAAAGTLTGNTLNSTVLYSSLQSFGSAGNTTIGTGTLSITGNITAGGTITAGGVNLKSFAVAIAAAMA
jgi:hypothetical protein